MRLPAKDTDSTDEDFRRPLLAAANLLSWIELKWDFLSATLTYPLAIHPSIKRLLNACGAALALYAAAIWVGYCYIEMPERWTVAATMEWAFRVGVAAVLPVFVIIGVLQGFALVGALFMAFFYIVVALLCSLVYLVWVVRNAYRRSAPWLSALTPTLLFGLGSSIAIATYTDGVNRYWDAPFHWSKWLIYFIAALSGWSALFCYIVGNRVYARGTAKRVVQWTLLAVLSLGILVHWHAGSSRSSYFLYKAVRDNPNDRNAWLKLAWDHYYQAEELEGEDGDENSSPPDPTPDYQEALEYFGKAVDLGAGGFDVYSARADAADHAGERQKARILAEQALRNAPSGTGDENVRACIEKLKEIVNRNSQTALQHIKEEPTRKKAIRAVRLQHLPRLLSWPFRSWLAQSN